MYNNLAYNSYMENNIGVESPTKLVEMMYEGILRFNTQAKSAIKRDDIEKRTYWINRSVAIFMELINSLNFEVAGDVSEYLLGLYEHQIKLLNEANLNNNLDVIDTVNSVVKGLLTAWRESAL